MKLTEKMLFGVWLDIKYAHELSEDTVTDLEVQLKEFRKARNKCKRLLGRAAGHYKEVYGREPKLH